jgi:hypothetical protein
MRITEGHQILVLSPITIVEGENLALVLKRPAAQYAVRCE